MSQDPRGRRLSKPEKEAILNDIRSRSLSFQSISKKHRVSISTVSRLAAENGLSSPRKRSSAVERPEHSYDREQRKSVLDRMLHSIDKMVERGGLSSRQLKDLASAAKEIAASRRSEDTIPDPTQDKTYLISGEQVEDVLENLVSCDAREVPVYPEVYFSVLDVGDAKDRGGKEDIKEAWEKMVEAFGRHGVRVTEEDYETMITKIQRDFATLHGPYRGEDHA